MKEVDSAYLEALWTNWFENILELGWDTALGKVEFDGSVGYDCIIWGFGIGVKLVILVYGEGIVLLCLW